MKKSLRRIRAAAGMGLVWGLAWFGAGLALLLIIGPGAADVPFPLGFGFLGFLAGALFSGVLSLVERGRRFDQLSIPRFAGWGAVGGLLFSLLFVLGVAAAGNPGLIGGLPFLAPLFAAAGASSAAGSLSLARMAGDRALPGAGADVEQLPGG